MKSTKSQGKPWLDFLTFSSNHDKGLVLSFFWGEVMNTELYIPAEFDLVSIAIHEKEHPTDQRVASYTFYDGYHENTLTNLLLLIKKYGFRFSIHWLECKDKNSKIPSIDMTINSEEELAKAKRMNSEIMRKYKIADMA